MPVSPVINIIIKEHLRSIIILLCQIIILIPGWAQDIWSTIKVRISLL